MPDKLPNAPDAAAKPARVAKKKTNARGRRQSHATRLPGKSTVAVTRAPGNRSAAVREGILHAAVECFGAFGYAGTSTRAVAERAAVSHPLLIYHFASKDQLWLSAMEDLIGRYQRGLEARISSVPDDDPVGKLRAFVEHFVEFSARTPQLHRIMTQQSTQGSDRIKWLIDNYLRDSFATVCGLIEHAQRDGAIRAGDPARLYYAVIGLAGTLFAVSSEFRILTGKNVFAAEELRQTVDLIFDFLLIPH
ncbi:TetR/AcrR family transcriptional regulator [Polycyclovorans algicola]|uniref:TetR/AcrR family transcriptional regulator n=1 Tax=Polycyclovorans algicola TaxID=616992 RepID=UPI000694D269|nr:TetR/AcrR family transcriptional regulator [Polycyclovorans algicola]